MKSILIFTFFITSTHVIGSPAALKNEDGSFKLSEKSTRQMGINFQKITNSGPWILPHEALVKVKFTTGVYRRYEGDITFVIAKVLKTEGKNIVIESSDLEAGDEVATSGTNFLRLTEADLNSDTVDSCAH